jgi:hypothetical protein
MQITFTSDFISHVPKNTGLRQLKCDVWIFYIESITINENVNMWML